jgi:hypothetical protein
VPLVPLAIAGRAIGAPTALIYGGLAVVARRGMEPG